MAEEEHQNHPIAEAIHEVQIQLGSDNFGFCVDSVGVSNLPGIKKVGLRAQIDTSPPFGSVQEVVTRFGGYGSWVPYKLNDNYNGVGESDIKKMEEHAVELEKDSIVKELETLGHYINRSKVVSLFEVIYEYNACSKTLVPKEKIFAGVPLS